MKNDEMMKTLERKNEGEKENLLSLFRKTKILLHMKFFNKICAVQRFSNNLGNSNNEYIVQ